MGFSYNVNVLNQKGSPAIYTDTFANRPVFGFAGRLFIANDTAAIYEDTGTAWVLIANVSSGAGTLQQVTTNGNTSNVGISVTAGGISSNSLTVTSLTPGSVPFVGAAGLITQDNTNLFFDDTNNRLGINTNTPSNNLDVHGAGTTPLLALNNTAGNQSFISFLNTSLAKWRIGNSSTNTFDILNVGLATNAITISSASNSVSFLASIKIQQGAGFAGIAGFNGIGCDAGGFFFQIGTNTNNPYFNFIGLTGARTYTYPDATGTLALTSNLSAYLPLSGGTLTGALLGTTIQTSSTASLNSASINFANANLGSSAFVINGGAVGGVGQRFVNNGSLNYNFQIGTNLNAANFFEITPSTAAGNTVFTTAGLCVTNNGATLIGNFIDDTINKLQVTGSAKITSSAQISNTKISSVSVGTISALGSSTITIISAKSGNISLGATITITGFENQNNGAIFITANVIGNWAASSLNKYGIGTIVSNESLGGNDYRGYGLLTPTVGTSSNAITLTLTNLQAATITNVMVTITENSN
jgi:hypothetical protein